MEKHDAARTKMAREASNRGRRVRDELQNVAADDRVERLVEVHCSQVAAPERDIRQRRRPDTAFRGFDCRLRDIGANDFPSLTDEACEQYGDVSYATSQVQTRIPSLIPAETRRRRVIGSIRRA